MPPTEMNTAGRLAKLLYSHKRENTPCGLVWARLFKLDSSKKPLNSFSDDERLEIREHQQVVYSEVRRLEDEVRQYCEGNKSKPEVLLKHVPKIKKALTDIPLNESWLEVRANCLDDATLTMLEQLETLLPAEDTIEDDVLQQITRQVDELANYVRSCRMSIDVRNWILTLLNAIRRAVDNYEIAGAKGFHSAMTSIMGDLMLYGKKARENCDDHSVWAGLRLVLERLGALSEVYAKLRPFVADLLSAVSGPTSTALIGKVFDRISG